MNSIAALLLSSAAAVSAVTIAEINGPAWLSPYSGQAVKNITGVVSAKSTTGFYLKSQSPDNDIRTSESIYVYTNTKSWVTGNVTVGDEIMLDAKVSDYRSDKTYLFLTELITPTNVQVLSKNNTVKPIQLGRDRTPPNYLYSGLDNGDVFGIPNNASQITVKNQTLTPELYGLDFWKSLTGEFVTIKRPYGISKSTQYGEVWVRGEWTVTGLNQRGGLSIVPGPSGDDANPEAILIGTPLGGTKNVDPVLGDKFEDITGVVTYQYGFFYVLPLTGLTKEAVKTPALPAPISFSSDQRCDLTFGDYNIENMAPTSPHMPRVAAHIVNYLKSPDVMFIQEIQDNSGPTDNGVVNSDLTLIALTNTIKAAGGPLYAYTYISPVNDLDGGQPGGNIRVAYLYNNATIALASIPGQTIGGPTDANSIMPGDKPHLKYNPGRISPSDIAFTASRKPLVAEWTILNPRRGKTGTLFTINVHFGSKGGSSSMHGDLRPPVNGGVLDRLAQTTVTSGFVKQLLAADPDAQIIVSGDFNEFAGVAPLKQFAGLLTEADVAAGIPVEERYTYTFDMNCQQLDHMLISDSLVKKGVRYEHVHVNTWVTYKNQTSDHDPSAGKFNVCQ